MDRKEVNMYYRFTSDDEPTDEQLAVLMEEVGEEVRRQSAEINRKLLERIEHEYQKAKEYYDSL
jgi:ribosomal protein L18E